MWKAYLFEVMTGLVGSEVEMSTNGRWDVRLNMTEQCQVTVQKSSLQGIGRRWWSPWRAGILLTFTAAGQSEEPIAAGPIVSPPDEYPDSLSFRIEGIRSLLEWRFAHDKEYPPGDEAAMRKSKLYYADSALDRIAQDLVKRATAKKGGTLPIVFGPRSPAANGTTRTYHGYDLANIGVDKLLGQLSDVEGGPDIMFRPEWVDAESRQHIRWRMMNGNDISPAIPQQWTMDVDLGRPRGVDSEVSMNTRGDHYANRVYATGAGEGAGLAIVGRERNALFDDYFPLMERTVSVSSATKTSTLASHASAGLSTTPLVELNVTVDGSDPAAALGRWHVGDKARVTIKGWFSIPDGTYELRVVRAAGDLDSPHTVLYFQEDAW